MAFISIIIPAYNIEKYIARCLDSIVSKHSDDIEVIVVDDGCTDRTGDIIDEYAAKYDKIKAIHKENGGVSSARNAGFDNAKGEWIWFVDGDDEVLDIGSLFTSINAEYDLFQFGYLIEENGNKQQYLPKQLTQASKEDFLFTNNSYFIWNMVFRKSVIDEYHITFQEGTKIGEDLEFQYKYLMVCKHPCSLNSIHYQYGIRQGSAMNSDVLSINKIVDTENILLRLAVFIKSNHVVEQSWLSQRLTRQLMNIINTTFVLNYDKKESLRPTIQKIQEAYKKIGYRCMSGFNIQIAKIAPSLYYIIYKTYHKIR